MHARNLYQTTGETIIYGRHQIVILQMCIHWVLVLVALSSVGLPLLFKVLFGLCLQWVTLLEGNCTNGCFVLLLGCLSLQCRQPINCNLLKRHQVCLMYYLVRVVFANLTNKRYPRVASDEHQLHRYSNKRLQPIPRGTHLAYQFIVIRWVGHVIGRKTIVGLLFRHQKQRQRLKEDHFVLSISLPDQNLSQIQELLGLFRW